MHQLSLQVYNGDAGSFHVNAVLVCRRRTPCSSIPGSPGPMRTGSPRWFSTARKTLKTIYVSQADPDFYFGAGVLKTVFPKRR